MHGNLIHVVALARSSNQFGNSPPNRPVR